MDPNQPLSAVLHERDTQWSVYVPFCCVLDPRAFNSHREEYQLNCPLSNLIKDFNRDALLGLYRTTEVETYYLTNIPA